MNDDSEALILGCLVIIIGFALLCAILILAYYIVDQATGAS